MAMHPEARHEEPGSPIDQAIATARDFWIWCNEQQLGILREATSESREFQGLSDLLEVTLPKQYRRGQIIEAVVEGSRLLAMDSVHKTTLHTDAFNTAVNMLSHDHSPQKRDELRKSFVFEQGIAPMHSESIINLAGVVAFVDRERC
jgi:hypothetical protein